MLTYLSIHNYTVADHIEIELATGMTAITGETGAGKSLMIDALSYCLGSRADVGAIRTGCKSFEIIAHFNIENLTAVRSWLAENNLTSDDECILRRVVKQDGHSLSTINGSSVPLKLTRQLASLLVTIHGQHEHQLLLKRETHRHIIDSYGQHQSSLDKVKQCYQSWLQTQKEIAKLTTQTNEQTRIDFIRFQLQELNDLQLTTAELKNLEQEHQQLSKAESLLLTSQQSLVTLSEDSQHAVTSQLQQIIQNLENIKTLSPHLKSTHELLNNALIQSEEAVNELQQYLQGFSPDPQRLQQIEQRLQRIFDIARKHHIKAAQIPQHQQILADELTQLTHRDERLAELQQQLAAEQQQYFATAKQLTSKRQQTAKKLSRQITLGIRQLGMPEANLQANLLAVESGQPEANGMEAIEFYVMTNPGSTPQPLKKVASGGELSRISLAIQVIAAQSVATPTLLFDEVDVGIGGATAQTVGELLQQLGKQHQVICVTHQAQVASQSQHHLRVEKQSLNKATTSTVVTLNKKQRIEELARMLSGRTISKQTLAHAEDMLS